MEKLSSAAERSRRLVGSLVLLGDALGVLGDRFGDFDVLLGLSLDPFRRLSSFWVLSCCSTAVLLARASIIVLLTNDDACV